MLRHDYRDGDSRRRRYCHCSKNVAVTVSAAAVVAASAERVGVYAPGRGMEGGGDRGGVGGALPWRRSGDCPPTRLRDSSGGERDGERAGERLLVVVCFFFVIGCICVNWHESDDFFLSGRIGRGARSGSGPQVTPQTGVWTVPREEG